MICERCGNDRPVTYRGQGYRFICGPCVRDVDPDPKTSWQRWPVEHRRISMAELREAMLAHPFTKALRDLGSRGTAPRPKEGIEER